MNMMISNMTSATPVSMNPWITLIAFISLSVYPMLIMMSYMESVKAMLVNRRGKITTESTTICMQPLKKVISMEIKFMISANLKINKMMKKIMLSVLKMLSCTFVANKIMQAVSSRRWRKPRQNKATLNLTLVFLSSSCCNRFTDSCWDIWFWLYIFKE